MSYAPVAARTKSLLSRKGRPDMVLRRVVTDGVYDPVTGGYTNPPTTTDFPVSGVLLKSELRNASADNTSPQSAQMQARKALISFAGKVQPGDRLVVDGQTFEVTGSSSVNPDNRTNIVWELHLK